jgi:SAM-dependent methyltransferase
VDNLVTTTRDRFWNPEAYARDRWIEKRAQELPAGSRVLDAGAGASKYRPFFKHCRYEAQDFCQYKGELVKYLQPIEHVCDITAIPLPSACLDAILCTEVIEHVVDPPAVLTEFARLLKPGGKLLLTAPFLSHLHMEPYHYYGGFTQFWYQHWLPVKGFRIESLTAVGGPGRVCTAFSWTFYFAWIAAEKKASPGRRLLSRCCRAFVRPLVLYIFPWLLPKFDPILGNEIACCDYLVVAIRQPPASS